MELTLDQVRQELSDIHDELLALPEEAYDRRSSLKDRQNELRQLSASLVEGQPLHDANILMAAYTRLQDVRDKLLDQHLAWSSTSVGDAGIEAEFTAAVNKAIDAGIGIDAIEARLKGILQQLKQTD